jgi:ribose transport system ATP-binding protein
MERELMANGNYILNLQNISKSFSGVKVLKSVSLSMKEGEILGLVGQNGAGKSTLMNIIGGVLKKDEGTIYLHEKEYDPADPLMAEKRGIAFIHQELNLFPNLTIAENMFIDGFPKKGFLRTIDYKKANSIVKNCIESLGMELKPEMKVHNLSMGQRQMIEIAKAVNKQSEIIIFDEPTTSLSIKEKENLFRVIRDLQNKGKSVIYISHILEDVFELCDRLAVMRDGQVVGEDDTDKLSRMQLIKMMVGRDLDQIFPTIEKVIGNTIFEAKGICSGEKVHNVDFTLKEGEIVGIFGIMGAGRTELAKAVFGVEEIESGEIRYNGERIYPVTPINCIKHGIAFITEDRRYEGLLMPKPVNDNLVCTFLDRLASNIYKIVDKKKENEAALKSIKDLNIKTHNKNTQPVKSLSGGNQQKVVLGKWLMLEPRVIIFDEPTRGVDVGAKYEIYSIINNMAKNKTAVLIISSEMEELIGVCDRVITMRKGEITGEFNKDKFEQEKILKAALEGVG